MLLARSPAGYAELSRMLALAHLERGEKGSPRFTLDQVAGAAKEWLVLTGCRKGPLTRALLDEGPRAAQRRLAQLIERFGRENSRSRSGITASPTTWRATTHWPNLRCAPTWRWSRRTMCTTPRHVTFRARACSRRSALGAASKRWRAGSARRRSRTCAVTPSSVAVSRAGPGSSIAPENSWPSSPSTYVSWRPICRRS